MKYCYSAVLQPEYHLSSPCITCTLSACIPLAEAARSESFCQGVGAVLSRGTNIGCALVLKALSRARHHSKGKIPRAFKVHLRLFLENLGGCCERGQLILIHRVYSCKCRFFASEKRISQSVCVVLQINDVFALD